MKRFFVKHSFFFGYALCILYAGALLMLESRLNYPQMNDDAYFYIQLTDSALHQGFAEAFNQLPPPERKNPPLLNLGMFFLVRYTPLSIEAAGHWLCIFSSLFAACGVFFLCRLLYSRLDLALATALLCLSLPGWYRYASGILRDPLFWMETIWFFGLALKSRQGEMHSRKLLLYTLGLAILGGAMLLTRKEAAVFLFLGGILFAFPRKGLAEKPLRKWGKAAGVILGFWMLSLLTAMIPGMAGIHFLPFHLLTFIGEL